MIDSKKYTEGRQPCDVFLSEDDYWVGSGNAHACYACNDEVSFCKNCKKDHHAGGYGSCIRVTN